MFGGGGVGTFATTTYTVEVDWDNNGTWASVPAMSAVTTSGRSWASVAQGQANAGSCTVILNNYTGDYSPFNAGSALYGKLLPGRPVRLLMSVTGGTDATVLWQGFLERITVDGITATLTAVGPLARLVAKRISPAAMAESATGDIVAAILDAAGWSASARDLDTGQTTVPQWFVVDTDALEAAREIEDTELGFLHESRTAQIVFESRHARWVNARSYTSQYTFTSTANPTLGVHELSEGDVLDAIVNDVRVTVQTYTESAATDDVLWTLPEAVSLPPTASRTFTADVGSGDVLYVANWITPAVGTDILPSNEPWTSYTPTATHPWTVAVVKNARTMDITITNTDTVLPHTLTRVQARGQTVTADPPSIVTDADTTSQTAFGVRTLEWPGRWFGNTAAADAYAEWVIAAYKDPHPVIGITEHVYGNATREAFAAGVTLSDRVTLSADTRLLPLGIAAQDFWVESIGHRIEAGRRVHWVTLALSPAGTSFYWVLGVGELGDSAGRTATRLGY